MTFDINAARQAGYNDEEISNFLAENSPNFDVKSAFESGYSPDEILEFVTSQQKKEPYKTPYDVEPERLKDTKNLSIQERMQLAQDLKTEREYRQGVGTSKGFLAGATLGGSEALGLGYQEGDLGYGFGETVGTLATETGLMKLFGLPGKVSQAWSNQQKAANMVLDVLKAAGVGATESTVRQLFKGEIPNIEEIAKHGATWGAIESVLKLGGAASRAVRGFLTSESANVPEGIERFSRVLSEKNLSPENTEKVANEALEFFSRELEVAETKAKSPQSVSNDLRYKKITQPEFEIKIKSPENPEPPSVIESLSANETSPVTQEELNHFSERSTDSTELGRNVVGDLNANRIASEENYEAAYNLVNEFAQDKFPVVDDVINDVIEQIQFVGRQLRTRPEQYTSVYNDLLNVFEDLGGILDSNGNFIRPDGNSIPLDRLMEITRRTGRMAKYGNLVPKITDRLKNVNRRLKDKVRSSIGNKEALELFNEAEEMFIDHVNKYRNPTTLKVRGRDFKPEEISKIIQNPTELGRLRNVLSQTQYRQVEREILESLNGMTHDKAVTKFRELRRYLSEDARNLANDVILSKTPAQKLTPAQRLQRTEKFVVDSIAHPKKSKSLIDMWADTNGNRQIRQSLARNPNRDQIINYLNEQNLYEASRNFINVDGEIDYNALKKFYSEASSKQTIRDMYGDNGLKFFEDLMNLKKTVSQKRKVFEKVANQPLKNFKVETPRGNEIIQNFKNRVEREKYPYITKVKDMWAEMPEYAKGVLTATGVYTFGPVKIISSLGGFKLLEVVAKHPRVRRAFHEALNYSGSNPYKTLALWKAFDEEFRKNYEE